MSSRSQQMAEEFRRNEGRPPSIENERKLEGVPHDRSTPPRQAGVSGADQRHAVEAARGDANADEPRGDRKRGD